MPHRDAGDPESIFIYMRKNILYVEINIPAGKVFDFTLNPENTPLWVDSILHEEIDTPIPQLGTHYRNQSMGGQWNEYEVTEFTPEKTFTFTQLDSSYRVRYDFDSLLGGVTKLTYTEWMEEGDLELPFDLLPLEKLKNLIESQVQG